MLPQEAADDSPEVRVREPRDHVDLAAALGRAPPPGFLEAEVLFNHLEWVPGLGANLCAGRPRVRSCSLPSGVSGKAQRLPSLIGDPVTDQIDASEPVHVRHLDQGPIHGGVTGAVHQK